MNTVDIFLLLLISLAAFIGYRFGALRFILELFKWSAAVVAGILLYSNTVDKVARELPSLKEWYLPLSFIAGFIVVYIILSVLQRLLMNATNNDNKVHVLDRMSGIIPGLLLGIVLSVITARLLTFSVIDSISAEAEKSEVAAMLSPYSVIAEKKITPLLEKTFDVALSNGKSDPEVYATDYYSIRPDLEQQMLQLVNAERKKKGLKALVADEQLRNVARAHSSDMMKRGYFSHMTPEGKDPFFRMRKAGINYKKAGENLAYASTLAKAHRGLMNSPSHRAAILNKSFGRIGIGIVDGGKSGLMISQEFKD
ncbi:CvpA family protein [Lacibacter sp. H375]|uniref:CvpA family protein n=1 Tax=Lacibacter sp. H375 TaxID=3133424 RepID=UPI0030C621D4